MASAPIFSHAKNDVNPARGRNLTPGGTKA